MFTSTEKIRLVSRSKPIRTIVFGMRNEKNAQKQIGNKKSHRKELCIGGEQEFTGQEFLEIWFTACAQHVSIRYRQTPKKRYALTHSEPYTISGTSNTSTPYSNTPATVSTWSNWTTSIKPFKYFEPEWRPCRTCTPCNHCDHTTGSQSLWHPYPSWSSKLVKAIPQ